MSNNGTLSGTRGVRGGVLKNFSTTVPPASTPKTTAIWNFSSPGVINGNSTVTMTAGTQANPGALSTEQSERKWRRTINLAANPNSGGQPAYIQIWITGNFTLSGGSKIVQAHGVHAIFYCHMAIWIYQEARLQTKPTLHPILSFSETPEAPEARPLIGRGEAISSLLQCRIVKY